MKKLNVLLIMMLASLSHTAFGGVNLLIEEDCESCSSVRTNPVAALRDTVAAKPACQETKARLTFYNPSSSSYRSHAEAKLEGGAHTRFSSKRKPELITSVEQSVRTGRPITLAADTRGSFGKSCNRYNSRCTIMVTLPGFDLLYPEYKDKFPNLPKDSFLGIIEDTGGAFRGAGTGRLDLASLRRSLANGAVPSYVNPSQTKWRRVENPCGKSAQARYCDLSNLRLADKCAS